MGHEYTHSYRTLLHLADNLATAGIPAIRFDYHGTGSSPGDAFSPSLLGTWVEDVRAASSVLQARTGHPPSLVGLRLGAAIAGLAASQMPVDQMVAWVPVVQGKRYVREREALGKLAGASHPEGADYLEAGGFILADQTAAALSQLDLRKLTYQVRGEILVVERDDMGTRPDLSEALSAQGIRAEVVQAPGYLEMMDEPHYTVVPHGTIERITAWLAQRLPEHRGGARAGPPPPQDRVRSFSDGMSTRRDELVSVPGPPELFGVLTEPDVPFTKDVPLLILTNAGSVHQVGPNQIYVELSRGLAASGFSTLRLDLRNLGDSIRAGVAQENHPYPSTASEDVSRAVDWAKRERGYGRTVVGGICSGAYTAFHAGLSLPPGALSGALIINPLTFYWREGMSLQTPPASQTIKQAKQYQQSVRDPQKWLKLLRGEVHLRSIAGFMLRRSRESSEAALRTTLEELRLITPRPLATDLARFCDLGLRADFVFSRSDPGYEVLRSGAGPRLRRLERRGQLSTAFIEQADHTFSRREWRAELVKAVLSRLDAYRVPTNKYRRSVAADTSFV
jgi:alpha-beta hydrolase superfamily lysophospholipase